MYVNTRSPYTYILFGFLFKYLNYKLLPHSMLSFKKRTNSSLWLRCLNEESSSLLFAEIKELHPNHSVSKIYF